MVEGYKHTDIGVIPEDWEVKRMEDFSNIQMGSSPKSIYYNQKGIGLPLIQGNADIKNRKTIIRHYTSHITRTSEKGDVIMSVRAPVGDIAISSFKSCIGRGVCSIRYVNRYLFHYLIFIESNWADDSAGSTIQSVTSEVLKDRKIPLPQLPEQKAIAEVLSDTDELIHTFEKRIAKKRNIKQGAMQKLLSPKEGWETKKLGEIGTCYRGVSYDGDIDLFKTDNVNSIRLLRSNNIQNSIISLKGLQFVNHNRVNLNQLMYKDDILICMANGSKILVGKSALFNSIETFQYTFGAFMGCFRVEKESVNKSFIFYNFLSFRYRNYISVLLSGSSINNLKPSDIEGMIFYFPKLEEQNRIATILSDMDKEIEQLEEKLDKYKDVKQGLMQQLLTGKIRLV
jgi:type I restriction enzyme, S subunit